MRRASLPIRVALCAVLLPLLNARAADENPTKKEGTPYTNAELKYSLVIPNLWERREKSPAESTIFIGPASEKFRPNLSILVQNRPGPTATTDAFADALLKAFKQKVPDASDPEKTDVKLGGAAAKKLVFTGTVSGHAMKFMKIVAFQGDKAFVLTYTHVAAGYATQLPDAQAFLDSFEFKK